MIYGGKPNLPLLMNDFHRTPTTPLSAKKRETKMGYPPVVEGI
jgi:hypothetical protein